MLITPPPTKAGADSFFMRDWMTKLQKVINEQGTVDFSSPPAIGDVTPNTGNFTTLTTTGSVGVGGTVVPGYGVSNSKNITGTPSAAGQINSGIFQTDVTNGSLFQTRAQTKAAAFTLTSLSHYNTYQGTIGAGSGVTTQIGFNADGTMVGATNNYGFYSSINSGTNRYGLYFPGTANNYLAGTLGVGVIPTARNNTTLQVKDGIGFPATQVTSTDVNTLDDYEEGTWTPTLSATGATFNYTVQQGAYTKIGNKVTATCTITLAGSGNTLTANQMFMTGLPFTSRNTTNEYFAGSLVWSNFSTAILFATVQMAPNVTQIALFKTTVAAITVANMNANDLSTTAGSTIQATITYFTA